MAADRESGNQSTSNDSTNSTESEPKKEDKN